MEQQYRKSVIVKPYERLSQEQVKLLDETSMKILQEPGIWCFNERAAKLFGKHGADVPPARGRAPDRRRRAGEHPR